jgi:hypothetical protein
MCLSNVVAKKQHHRSGPLWRQAGAVLGLGPGLLGPMEAGEASGVGPRHRPAASKGNDPSGTPRGGGTSQPFPGANARATEG